jgi:hypothetical protein
MVTYGAAPIAFQSFAGQGVAACLCEFMRWGWWIGEVRNPSGNTAIERFHLATWVAGVLPSTSEIGSLASRSAVVNWNGHIIGNVASLTSRINYIAAGNMAANFNFGTHQGNFSFSNFDRGGILNRGNPVGGSGTVTNSGNSPNFSGSFTIPGAGTGSVAGSFYKSLATGFPAEGIGGAFSIATAAAKVAGTFAGRR